MLLDGYKELLKATLHAVYRMVPHKVPRRYNWVVSLIVPCSGILLHGSDSDEVIDQSIVDFCLCVGLTDYVSCIVNVHDNDAGKMI